MTTIAPFQVVLTVSGVLLGFLFTGFWWALNRELRFKLPQRHFKLGTGMLLAGMVLVAIFGIILPMKSIAGSDHVLF